MTSSLDTAYSVQGFGDDGYDQYDDALSVRLDPSKLQETVGQKKGILRRLLTKFKSKLIPSRNKPPSSPKAAYKPPRSPNRRPAITVAIPAAHKTPTVSAAATATSSTTPPAATPAAAPPTAAAPASAASHTSSTRRPSQGVLPPWRQPPHNASTSGNQLSGSGSGIAGITSSAAATSGTGEDALPGPSSGGMGGGNGMNGAASLVATPSTSGSAGGGGGGGGSGGNGGGGGGGYPGGAGLRSPRGGRGGVYMPPSSPGALAARPRPHWNAGGGDGGGGSGSGTPAVHAAADGSGSEPGTRRQSPAPRSEGVVNGGSGRGGGHGTSPLDVSGGSGRGPSPQLRGAGGSGVVNDIAFSEVLLSEVTRCNTANSVASSAIYPTGIPPRPRGAYDTRSGMPFDGGYDGGGGGGHGRGRHDRSRLAPASEEYDISDAAAAAVGPGGLGGELISDEVSALVGQLEEELADVAAARNKHGLRLKLVDSLLEMMPPQHQLQGAGGGPDGALATRLTAERSRLTVELTALASREELLSYARREWGKVMSVMSGVRVSRCQAGPLQAILFSDTLARIRAFQKDQARKAAAHGVLTAAPGPYGSGEGRHRGQQVASASVLQGHGGGSSSSHAGRYRTQSHLSGASHATRPVSARGSVQSQSHRPLNGLHAGVPRNPFPPFQQPGQWGLPIQQPGLPLPLAPITETEDTPPLMAVAGHTGGGNLYDNSYNVRTWGGAHGAVGGGSGSDVRTVVPMRMGPSGSSRGGVGGGGSGGGGGLSHERLQQHQQLLQKQDEQQRRAQQRQHVYPPHGAQRSRRDHHGGSRGSARQEPAHGAALHGRYGSSAVDSDQEYDSQDDEGSVSSGEMYRSIASLARDMDDSVSVASTARERLATIAGTFHGQHHHRHSQQHQQQPSLQRHRRRDPYPAAPEHAGGPEEAEDGEDALSDSSLESAFIAKCLTATRNSLDIRRGAAGRSGAGYGSGVAVAGSSTAFASMGLSRADRQLYSSAIHSLRTNVLNAAGGNTTASNIVTGAVTLPGNTVAGIAGSPADTRPVADIDEDVEYGEIERQEEGYFDFGAAAAAVARMRRGGEPCSTPTSASGANSMGSVEDMLAAVAVLRGGAGAGGSGPDRG